jgi:hypothetical protein
MMLVLLAAMLAVPGLNRLQTAALLHVGSPESLLYRCDRSFCSAAEEAEISGLVEQRSAASVLALQVLGNLRLRHAGEAPAELDAAEQLLSRAMATAPSRPDLLVNIAVVKAGQGVRECNRERAAGKTAGDSEKLFSEAVSFLDRAAAVDPALLSPIYNKSWLLRRAGDAEGSERAMQQAISTDSDEVDLFESQRSRGASVGSCPERFNPNRNMMTEPIPPGDLFAESFSAAKGIDRFLYFDPVLAGPFPASVVAVFSVAAVFLLALLWVASRFLRVARRCGKCGGVSCSKCRPELAYVGLCEACFFVKIRGSFMDPKELWFREKRAQRHEVWRIRAARGLTFLLPGLGHVLRGMTVRGVVMLLLFALALPDALLGGSVVPGPSPVLEGPGPAVAVLGGGVAGLVWLVALIDIYRARRAL